MLPKRNKTYYDSTTDTVEILVKKLYLVNPSASLLDLHDTAFLILKAVSEHFSIPFRHIYTTGSAHVGFSLKNKHMFIQRESDLDLAIVDSEVFKKYMHLVLKETEFYTSINFKTGIKNAYMANLAKGMLHPLYFPAGKVKLEWDSFFTELSRDYRDVFSSITACVFLSEECFENKQIESIIKFKADAAKEHIGDIK